MKSLVPESQKGSLTRREFVRKSIAATCGFTVLPSYLALGKEDAEGNVPPSQRINLGCVGVGGRGRAVINDLCGSGKAVPVALCDVDFKASKGDAVAKKYPQAKTFEDFRVMFDKMGDDIDAVSVATPDHTHFPVTLEAMRRGKHVYVEKPLTHSFREAAWLMEAEKKYDVVTQMGNQGHTSTGYEQFKHLFSEGIINDITLIDAWMRPGIFCMYEDKRFDKWPEAQKKPEGLDWDLWCGPAEQHPYNKLLHPFHWRSFLPYGSGILGDWGAHIIDFAHEILQLGLPEKIELIESKDRNGVLYPLSSELKMHFPGRSSELPACVVHWRDGHDSRPQVDRRFWEPAGEEKKAAQAGDKEAPKARGPMAPKLPGAGTLLHSPKADYLVSRGSHSSVSRILPRARMMDFKEDMKVKGPKYSHGKSFVHACMDETTVNSPFSVGGELTQVLLLGVIGQLLGEDLEFDRASQTFKGNDRANAMLEGPPPRKGWEEYYSGKL